MNNEMIKKIALENGFTIKDGLDDLKPYVYEFARALLASGWQPICDANHEIEERILATNMVTVVTCYWDGDGWINERSKSCTYYKPTHFMPLPQPPEKE